MFCFSYIGRSENNFNWFSCETEGGVRETDLPFVGRLRCINARRLQLNPIRFCRITFVHHLQILNYD